jgi:hypothetical protein
MTIKGKEQPCIFARKPNLAMLPYAALIDWLLERK